MAHAHQDSYWQGSRSYNTFGPAVPPGQEAKLWLKQGAGKAEQDGVLAPPCKASGPAGAAHLAAGKADSSNAVNRPSFPAVRQRPWMCNG